MPIERHIIWKVQNFETYSITLSQLSQESLTHIIRNGEFMGAGWWTGIQTWIGEQWDKKGDLTLKSHFNRAETC